MIATTIIKYISSRTYLAISLLFMYGSYAYFLSNERPYEAWLRFLFYHPAGVFLYGGLIINLIFINVRVLRQRIRKRKITPDNIKDMDSYIVVPLSGIDSLKKMSDWLRSKGFKPEINSNRAEVVKGRYSFLPGMIFITGLIIFLASQLFSAHLRQTEDAVLKEGEKKIISGTEIQVAAIKAPELSEFLLIEGEDAFRLNEVYVELIVSGNKYIATGGFPVKIDKNYYRITHLGFSQMLDLKTQMIQFQKDLELDVLPPAKKDTVDIGQSLALTFELQPENIIKKGLLEAKKFNLTHPSYHLTISNVGEGELSSEKPMELSIKPLEKKKLGSYEIELGKNALFVKMQSVRDPALLWLYVGTVLSLLGLLLMASRFFWYEKTMAVVINDREAHIGYSEEFYKKWGIYKFQLWQEDIAGLFSESYIDKS